MLTAGDRAGDLLGVDRVGRNPATKAAPNAGLGWAYLAKSAPAAAAGPAKPSSAASYIEAFNAVHRPKSLVEMHAEALAGRGGGAAAAPAAKPRAAFDRERDLAMPRKQVDAAAIIERSAGLYSRFGGAVVQTSTL